MCVFKVFKCDVKLGSRNCRIAKLITINALIPLYMPSKTVFVLTNFGINEN